LYLENELTPGAFTPDRLVALELLAAQAAVSLENAHLLGREREARQRAEADRQRALALGEATALLSSSPDQDGIARALRGFCARGLADWAVLDVIEGGSITHLVEVHRDEAREPLLRRLGERYPVRVAATLLSAPGPEETAPTHLPSLWDEQLRQRCEDADHAALVREVGVRSLFVLPLVARGARLGVLSLGSASPYRFGEADVELGGELARRVAMALDNERLTALETKLRQSQKMEAIGRLAGGVAHDFNNLLSVILSYAELLEEKAGHEGETHEQLTEIRRAAARATDLTRQLLAFGRQQMLNPVVLDLNKVVSDMHNLLARLLGDEVELALRLSQTPMTVRADGGQIGQVLMNLTVNARDAMPHGGRLIIETGKVELDETERQGRPGTAAGPYALLSVADTGQGLDPQTQDRIFEPFFTTKEPGKGTGLGLATVLGIVQQSGGHISLDSRPGHGAIFRIYLPWAEPDRGDELSTDPTASGLDATTKTTGRGVPLAAAGETILLVEDDDQVRRATRTALERSGYAVVEASGPGDALLIFEQGQTAVDLLVTDIQMPRMTGVELTRRLRTTRPNLPSLLMSGYADGAIVHDALREAATSFLQKPVTPQALLRAVRQLLDADRNNGRVQKNGTHPDR
jgi:signal transduction histidine kinase/CheY-like chemotaxis protein